MERIENILRRIQELYYSKHEKTGIDIDLMLDYTRVMYADLLEWRKRFKDVAEPPAPARTEEHIAAVEEQPAVQEAVQAEAVKPEDVQPLKQEEPKAETPAPASAEAAPVEERVPGPEKEEAEAELVQEVLHNSSSAISFEPPSPTKARLS